MAYATKYKADYLCDDGSHTEIFIQKLNWTGGTSEIILSADPLTIRRGNTGQDKFEPIVGSSATLSIVSESSRQYIEFFTNSDKDYRVLVYKGGSIYWVGFIQTDIYVEPYQKAPFVIQVTANDGLANLKDEEIDSTLDVLNSENNGRSTPLSVILYRCLKDMDIFVLEPYQSDGEIYLYHAINLDAEDHKTTLDQLHYLFYWHVNDEGRSKYDVLSDLMELFNARIFQANGALWIMPIYAISDTTDVYFISSSSNDFTNNITPVSTNLIVRDFFYTDSNQTLEILPAIKEASTSYNPNIIPLVDSTMKAEDWSNSTTLMEWTKSGVFETIRQSSIVSEKGVETYLKTEQNQTGFIYDRTKSGHGQGISFDISFDFFIKTPEGFDYDLATDNARIYYSIEILDFRLVQSYFDVVLGRTIEIGGWVWLLDPLVNTIVENYYQVQSATELNRWITVNLKTRVLDMTTVYALNSLTYADRQSVDVDFRLKGLVTDSGSASFEEVYFKKFKVELLDVQSGYPLDEYTQTTVNSGNYSIKKSFVSPFISRKNSIVTATFKEAFYNNASQLQIINTSDEYVDAALFRSSSGSYDQNINELHYLIRYSTEKAPQYRIIGDIRGNFGLNNILVDEFMDSKEFLVNSMEENDQMSIKNTELVERLPYTT